MIDVSRSAVKLVMEMAQYLWSGDPELVNDKHWAAYQEVADAIGYEIPE